MNISELIKLCKKGDSKAQKMLYNQLAPSMYKVCLRYFDNEFDAEDTLISGLYKFFQKIDSFQYKDEARLFGFVKKIVVNESLMLIRNRTNLNMVGTDHADQIITDITALDELEANDILKLIRELPTGYRTVFNLYVIEGYNHREISELLEISINTSKTQLHKAKNTLQKTIKINSQQYGT